MPRFFPADRVWQRLSPAVRLVAARCAVVRPWGQGRLHERLYQLGLDRWASRVGVAAFNEEIFAVSLRRGLAVPTHLKTVYLKCSSSACRHAVPGVCAGGRRAVGSFSRCMARPPLAIVPANHTIQFMSTVTEIEGAIAKLTLAEQREIALWLEDHLLAGESPEMLAAMDVGIRSLEQNGARPTSRPELAQKVRQWAGVSR